MPEPNVADVLERCAVELHAVAFDFREPRTSPAQSDQMIDESAAVG